LPSGCSAQAFQGNSARQHSLPDQVQSEGNITGCAVSASVFHSAYPCTAVLWQQESRQTRRFASPAILLPQKRNQNGKHWCQPYLHHDGQLGPRDVGGCLGCWLMWMLRGQGQKRRKHPTRQPAHLLQRANKERTPQGAEYRNVGTQVMRHKEHSADQTCCSKQERIALSQCDCKQARRRWERRAVAYGGQGMSLSGCTSPCNSTVTYCSKTL
jgi:hypothetical protein